LPGYLAISLLQLKGTLNQMSTLHFASPGSPGLHPPMAATRACKQPTERIKQVMSITPLQETC
jgi:hypothetical protein